MAPMVSNLAEKKIDFKKLEKTLSEEKKKLLKIRKYIENNFEYVGEDLSKRAREIYYNDKSKKTIYGTTTKEEREELSEEGIEILSVPWIDKEN